MATWQEFDNAVGNTKGSDPVAKKWADAAGGANGGANAGPVESYSSTSEFASGVIDSDKYDPIVTPAGPAPDGTTGYVRGDRSQHAHFGQHSESDFYEGASRTCSGDAQITKKWQDACGGGMGSVSDEYKE